MVEAKWNVPLREVDLPSSYYFKEGDLASLLQLSYEAVLFFKHPQAQVLPLGQVSASKLVFYQEAVRFWGWNRLRKIAKWWMENYFFSAESLETFLETDYSKKISYKAHLLGGTVAHSIWFSARTRVVYSHEQLRSFRDVLSKRMSIPLEISELSVRNLSDFFSLR